ncbi:MAG: hypothetical protein ACREQ1_11080 [Woeseiaceae bacterium]
MVLVFARFTLVCLVLCIAVYGSRVSFGNGITEIPLTLLRDGTLTAVYLGRGCTRGCDPPGDEEQRPVEPP